MEQDRRPREKGRDLMSQELPRRPASRPKDPRPRSGNAASRERARQQRLAQSEPARRGGEEPPHPGRRRPPPPERTGSKPRPAGQRPPQRGRKKAKKPHRVYNTNFGFKFLVMLAVVAVIVLSMIIFFKVKHIEVLSPEGSDPAPNYYSAQEIVAASGINLDDNLLSLSKATVAARIHAALPYVNDIQIKKQLPGTVIISYTEFEITYAIEDINGDWWLMSRNGTVLEAVDEKTAKTHLYVTGMPILVPKPGESIQPYSDKGADMSEIGAKQKVILDIIPALEDAGFVKQLCRIDVSTSYDLTLWWIDERYEIRLGTTENLDYKLLFLASTLENSDVQRRSGTIDLSFQEDDKVHFLEFR